MPIFNRICPHCARAAGVSETRVQDLLEVMEWYRCNSCGRMAGTISTEFLRESQPVQAADCTRLDAPPVEGFAARFMQQMKARHR